MDNEINPDSAIPKKLPQSTPSIPVEKPNWIAFILVALVFTVIGAMAFSIVIFSGQVDTFMTDGQCSLLIQNASNVSVQEGYMMGIYESQNLVINEGVLPYLYNNSGNITLGFARQSRSVNWTQIQNLNNQEVNK